MLMPGKAPVTNIIRRAGGLDAVFAKGGEEFGGVGDFVPLIGMAVAMRQEGRTAEMVAVEAAILPEEKAVVIRHPGRRRYTSQWFAPNTVNITDYIVLPAPLSLNLLLPHLKRNTVQYGRSAKTQ